MLLSSNACHAMCNLTKVVSVTKLSYVDYIFGNETEARTFAKVRGWEVFIYQLLFSLVH